MAHETKFQDGANITDYMATGIAEGFEEASCNEDVVKAWSYLIGTGLAYKLQGWFGRNANTIIDTGMINADGTVDWDKVNDNI
jgi:hypothetical protein